MEKNNDILIDTFLKMEEKSLNSYSWNGEDIWPLIRTELFRALQGTLLNVPYISCAERHKVHCCNKETSDEYLRNINECDILIVDMSSQYLYNMETGDCYSRVSGGIYDALGATYRVETATLNFGEKHISTEIKFKSMEEGFHSNEACWKASEDISKVILQYFKECDSAYIKNYIFHLLQYVYKWIFYEETIKNILIKTNPNLLLVTSGYEISEMIVVKSAKKLKIKTAELQHGIINRRHMGYRRAAGISKEYTPDHLFSYAEIRNEIIGNSYTPNQISPIGNYYLEKACENTYIGETTNKILIILTISDEELLEFAEELSLKGPEEMKIKCRLHPEENRNGEHLCSLMKRGNGRIEFELPETVNVYDSIKEAEWVIGTNTTVLYEATMFRKKCIELSEISSKPSGDFHTVSCADDFLSILINKADAKCFVKCYFKAGYVSNMQRAVKMLLKGNESD